jgi:hypothetical protein
MAINEKEWRSRVDRLTIPGKGFIPLLLPEIAACKTCLYIGANARQFTLHPILRHCKLTVLEIWKPYVDGLRIAKPEVEVIQGDVRSMPACMEDRWWDLIVWWHGPEHILIPESVPLLDSKSGRLPAIAKVGVLLGTTYGKTDDQPYDDNPYQFHVSGWSLPDFECLGYAAIPVEKNGKRIHIIAAWKREKEV